MSNVRIKIPGFMTKIVNPGKSQKMSELIDKLKTPHTCEMSSKKMLAVEAKGYPGNVASNAFQALFSTYFKIMKGKRRIADLPCARFPLGVFGMNPNDIVGKYALPISDAIKEVPPRLSTTKGLTVMMEDWEYGTVAEILHVGPYSSEPETIKKLEKYIKEKGYEAIDPHEEEYHVGPTMFGKGNPQKYTTLIRYRLRTKK